MSTRAATVDRSTGIDVLRGLLIVAVILGHFSEITERNSLLTWLGAGLRMPLFIGLTGYLFNLERSRAEPLICLQRRYYQRLILPWLLACVVHLTLLGQIDAMMPLTLLIWPPFHLWFVPVMMAFILIAAATRWAPAALMAVSLVISLAAMYLLGVGHVVQGAPAWMPDRRFFIYPVYFFYGVLVANRTPDRGKGIAAVILAPIGFLWWCSLHGTVSISNEVAAELTTCLPLIYLLPWAKRLSMKSSFMAGIGRDSLFFYLWHPAAFAVLSAGGLTGLGMLGASAMLLVATRTLLSRSPVAAKLFGVTTRRHSTSTTPVLAAPAMQGTIA